MSASLRIAAAALLIIAAPAVLGHDARPTGRVFPSGPTVPENLLRIELRFSAPVWTPLDMRDVRLYGSDGREIRGAFLDLPLPAPDGRRVTILMHPGRVKTGLGPNLALGRALRAGSTVTLVVDDPALARPLRKTWRVTGFDADAPHPARWSFGSPREGTRDPLVVHLDAPLSSTAESYIAVRAPDGGRLAGRGRFARGETVWRFVPDRPWRSVKYALVTHPDLEDPAGNRPCGPFEMRAKSRARCAPGTARSFIPDPRHERTVTWNSK